MSSSKTPLRWGVIGPGRISRRFGKALSQTDTGHLYAAAASSDASRAQAFVDEFGGGKAYGSYQALLDDPEVDAVYIGNLHTQHAEWSIKAARAGKHILCEKPASLNYGEIMAVIDEVEQAGVFYMEAFMYRCHSQTARVIEWIRAGEIGEVQHMRASFCFDAGPNQESRLMANALGGGGILDVGCYPISMLRRMAGAARGKDFLDPGELKGIGHLDPDTGVDGWASVLMKFEGGIVAEALSGVRLNAGKGLTIIGTKGAIEVENPWGCDGNICLKRRNQDPVQEKGDSSRELMVYEVEVATRCIAAGETQAPEMSWADTLGNMKTLDRWREELNFLYEQEQPANLSIVHGGTLKRGSAIPTASLPGIAKPVSRLVMGHAMQRKLPEVARLWDHYFEQGGNTFDEGTIYRGRSARKTAVGQWLKHRGLREECILIEKGAHTPWCQPNLMEDELAVAMEGQQTDYFDLYMMHRDNPEVPVGEFVDVMTGMQAKGHIHAYGFSNWSMERTDEAVAYAKEKGLTPPICLSNQFSMARLVNPIWAGCITSATPEFKAWHTEHNFALLPWSSQAKGFFSTRSAPDKLDDKLLVDGFYSDDNFERKKRCLELAEKKGIAPTTLALAYVLCQPFPTFPLIGPSNPGETRQSIDALNVEITPDEMAWLNLEA